MRFACTNVVPAFVRVTGTTVLQRFVLYESLPSIGRIGLMSL